MSIRHLFVVGACLAAFATSAGCDSKPPERERPSAATTTTQERATSPAQPVERAPVAPTEAAKPAAEAEVPAALLDPSKATEKAPNTFKVKFTTTKGDFTIEAHRDWAPNGADRFYNLVKLGYFQDLAFFRAVDGFMVQFGIHGSPKVNEVWREARIKDDPVKESNKKGFITFATSGADSRTVQMFINYGDNARLDGMGFSPFGKVVEGMNVVDSLYKGYGEGAPQGRGPHQGRVQMEGNAYLRSSFPLLDYIKSAAIL